MPCGLLMARSCLSSYSTWSSLGCIRVAKGIGKIQAFAQRHKEIPRIEARLQQGIKSRACVCYLMIAGTATPVIVIPYIIGAVFIGLLGFSLSLGLCIVLWLLAITLIVVVVRQFCFSGNGLMVVFGIVIIYWCCQAEKGAG